MKMKRPIIAAMALVAFVLIQTAPGLSVCQAVAQMRTSAAATGANMNGGAPVRVEMSLPSANTVLAPGSHLGLNPSLSVTNAAPAPMAPSVAVTPLPFAPSALPAAAKSVSVVAAGPIFPAAQTPNAPAASALVETGVALSEVPVVRALLPTLARFFDGSRAIDGSALSAPAASDAPRANVSDNLPVTLTMESFPVVSANYGPDTVERIQQLIDKARGGGISDIRQLGMEAFALAQSLYIYTEPEAAKTRENGFQLVKYAAEHGDARAMYSAAHMHIRGEGTAQNFDEAKRLFKLIAVSEGSIHLEARKSLDKLESLIQKGTPPKPVAVETKIIGRRFSEIAAAKAASAQEGVVTMKATLAESMEYNAYYTPSGPGRSFGELHMFFPGPTGRQHTVSKIDVVAVAGKLKSIFTQAALSSILAHIPLGDYKSANGFKVEVRTGFRDEVQIRADGDKDGRAQFASLYFNRATGKITEAPLVRGHKEFKLIASEERDGVRYFTLRAGGRWESVDKTIILGIDSVSGRLVSMTATTKVAWGLPSGWHSGPFKTTTDDFITGRLDEQSK